MTRGDVYRVRFGRGRGHEQRGPRYGVIVQADALLDLSTVIVAPTSTTALPATFRPEIELKGTRTRVLVEHVRSIDLQRLGKRVRRLTREEQQAVDDALNVVLGL
jgi:mRNA interferase MazF